MGDGISLQREGSRTVVSRTLGRGVSTFVTTGGRRVLRSVTTLITVGDIRNAPARRTPFNRNPHTTLSGALRLTTNVKLTAHGYRGCVNCTRLTNTSPRGCLTAVYRISIIPINGN